MSIYLTTKSEIAHSEAIQIKSQIIVSIDEIRKFAEMIIEYDMVDNSNDISTLADAKNVAKLLNTNANPDEFESVAEKYGIVDTKVCGDLPFVACSYGYTRSYGAAECSWA